MGEHDVFKLHVISLHFLQREEKHILSALPYVTFIMLMYNMSAWKELIKFCYYYWSILAFCNNNQDLTQNFKVRGCPLVTIERMDDEFTKMLQGCDCHSTEYVARWRILCLFLSFGLSMHDFCPLLCNQMFSHPRHVCHILCRPHYILK